MAMKTIKLAFGAPIKGHADEWKVITVKNSIDYYPGEILHKEEVERLCRNASWDVAIVKLNPEEGAAR